MTVSIDLALLDEIRSIAAAAGEAIMSFYSSDYDVELKDDKSPLTAADKAAHNLIVERLAMLANAPILSEESSDLESTERLDWRQYWLVDPLDGTKEFIKRNGEFTVNIALIDNHQAVLGVVFAPALGLEYAGAHTLGAFKAVTGDLPQRIQVRQPAASPLRIVGSRSHASATLQAYADALGPHVLKPMGSSLKICVVAAGEADIYPRLGPTSEWDTAASQAILESAGGSMITVDGQTLKYNAKESLLNPHFLAFGDAERDWLAHL